MEKEKRKRKKRGYWDVKGRWRVSKVVVRVGNWGRKRRKGGEKGGLGNWCG